jgi:hypothetical protein
MKHHLGPVARLKHTPRMVYWDLTNGGPGIPRPTPGLVHTCWLRHYYAPLRRLYERQRIERGQLKVPSWEELAPLMGQY